MVLVTIFALTQGEPEVPQTEVLTQSNLDCSEYPGVGPLLEILKATQKSILQAFVYALGSNCYAKKEQEIIKSLGKTIESLEAIEKSKIKIGLKGSIIRSPKLKKLLKDLIKDLKDFKNSLENGVSFSTATIKFLGDVRETINKFLEKLEVKPSSDKIIQENDEATIEFFNKLDEIITDTLGYLTKFPKLFCPFFLDYLGRLFLAFSELYDENAKLCNKI